MNRLDIKNLDHSFGKTEILKNISLEFDNKKFITIIGPNGCGKTTFVKKMLKNYKINRKTIYLNNEDIYDIHTKDFAKVVASVPQNTDIKYNFSVQEVVRMGRHPYINRFKGESEEDHLIIENVLEEMDLVDLKDRAFPTLSGGEKQRVIIARALAQQPGIIILDEPINHLDIRHKVEIMKLLKKLSIEKDLMVITILHDLNFSLRYSDYCVLLQNGDVYKDGVPTEVLTEKNISDVYEIDVTISASHDRGKMILYN